MNKIEKILTILIILNLVILLFVVQKVFFTTDNQNIENFYNESIATLVSPHHLRSEMDKGNDYYLLIDTREQEDYLSGHITGAVNIVPDKNLVSNFEKVIAENPDKDLIIYCYTHVCMRGKRIGKELAESGLYIKELGIGFNEWKNFWKEWNYESEWNSIDIAKYITVGEEVGVIKKPQASIFDKKTSSGCSANEGYEC